MTFFSKYGLDSRKTMFHISWWDELCLETLPDNHINSKLNLCSSRSRLNLNWHDMVQWRSVLSAHSNFSVTDFLFCLIKLLNLWKNNRYVCTSYLDVNILSILRTGKIHACYFQNETRFDMHHIWRSKGVQIQQPWNICGKENFCWRKLVTELFVDETNNLSVKSITNLCSCIKKSVFAKPRLVS